MMKLESKYAMAAVLLMSCGICLGFMLVMRSPAVQNQVARLPEIRIEKRAANNAHAKAKGYSHSRIGSKGLKAERLYTNKDNVTSMARGGGRVWVGTTGGIRSFPDDAGIDEIGAKELDLDRELPSVEVRGLLWNVDRLVVLTADGMATVRVEPPDTIRVEPVKVPELVPIRSATTMTMDGRTIVIGTDRRGLFALDGSSAGPLAGADELTRSRITSVASFEGAVFAGTLGQGMFRIKHGRTSRFTVKDGLPGDWVTELEAAGDRLMISTLGGEAFYSRGLVTASSDKPAGECGVGGLPCSTLSAGGLSLMGSMDGLRVSDGKGWKEVKSHGPGDNDVNAMVEWDKRLWVGSFDRGLCSFDGGTWRTFTERDGLPSNMVNHLAAGKRGLWIATMKGASRFDGHSFHTLTRADGLASDHVTAIAEWGERTAFATPAGVTILDRGAMTTYTTLQGLPSDNVYALVADGPNLWAGTLAGLARFDGSNWKAYTFQTGDLPDNWINALAAREGELWVGTYDAGLAKLSAGGKRFYLEGRDIPYGWVNPNAMTSDGSTMWVGLTGGGLLYLNGEGFGTMSAEEGLAGNDVTGIVRFQDRLWVGSRSGLTVVEETSGGLAFN